LTKALGVGVMTTALKKGLLPQEGYDEVGGWGVHRTGRGAEVAYHRWKR
jgi:selenophosphate synthase